jgi:hypothetical protein
MKIWKILVLSLGVATLCLTATPAMAGLPEQLAITVNQPYATWVAGTSELTFNKTNAFAFVNSAILTFGSPPFSSTLEDFLVRMHLIGNNGSTAATVDVGSFTITDQGGHSIIGDFTGTWTRNTVQNKNQFTGMTSNMHFSSPTSTFQGDFLTSTTITPMVMFAGLVDAQTGTAPWFGSTDWAQPLGSTAGVTVSAVPVPVAVLLGLIGLGTAGLGLRKFV